MNTMYAYGRFQYKWSLNRLNRLQLSLQQTTASSYDNC
jgi:hypothetical protein